MYSQKRKKGNIAEEIVVSHLKNAGFLILDQNYLRKWGEIDIVAEKAKKIHFVEVKSIVLRKIDCFMRLNRDMHWKISELPITDSVSRETPPGQEQSDMLFDPTWNMTKKKKSRLSRVIRTYLADKYKENMPDFQVDLISVLLDFYRKIAYIKRIENILLDFE